MSDLSAIAHNIAAASAELAASNRWAAWLEREADIKRELASINKKRCALMALNRAGDERGYKAYVKLSEATAELVVLDCGCCLELLSLDSKWARECEGHKC